MENKEILIVSFTSWKPRFANIPIVLDTIFNQSYLPDKVVFNVADDDVLPDSLQSYLDAHNVEIFRVPDTKVFKKIIPTLRRYPDACIISIDDDRLYPSDMIKEFMDIHKKYPRFPISGNRVALFGYQGHNGCSSLVKAEFFGEYLYQIDDDLIKNCPGDDPVYAFLCTKAGHPYIRTINEYWENLPAVNPVESYTSNFCRLKELIQTRTYLEKRFGPIDAGLEAYAEDEYWASLFRDIEKAKFRNAVEYVKNSHSYKLGNALINPFGTLKKLLNKN